jgi:hypothetical protein
MKHLMMAAIAAALIAPPAMAQTVAGANAKACKALSDAVEDGQQLLAQKQIAALGDDSAPRATMRAAEASAEYGRAQANLSLMVSLHCPAYTHPIGPDRFLNAAAQCQLAVRKPGASGVPAECKRADWKPFPSD